MSAADDVNLRLIDFWVLGWDANEKAKTLLEIEEYDASEIFDTRQLNLRYPNSKEFNKDFINQYQTYLSDHFEGDETKCLNHFLYFASQKQTSSIPLMIREWRKYLLSETFRRHEPLFAFFMGIFWSCNNTGYEETFHSFESLRTIQKRADMCESFMTDYPTEFMDGFKIGVYCLNLNEDGDKSGCAVYKFLQLGIPAPDMIDELVAADHGRDWRTNPRTFSRMWEVVHEYEARMKKYREHGLKPRTR